MTGSRITDIGVEILHFGVVWGPFLSLTKPQRFQICWLYLKVQKKSNPKLNDVYLRLFLLSGTWQHGRPLFNVLGARLRNSLHHSWSQLPGLLYVWKHPPPPESSCQPNLQLCACCQGNVELSNHVMPMAEVKPAVTKVISMWEGSPKREPTNHRQEWWETWAPLSVDITSITDRHQCRF